MTTTISRYGPTAKVTALYTQHMKPADIELFFQTLQQANPTPTTELVYASVFELLTAVLLSAQATDISVNKATAQLFKVANTPEAMLALGPKRLEHYIQHIGLFRTKARHLLQTCQILLDRYEGQVPDQRQALESLPGVGRKTANVILNCAFGHATIAVDTHIFRVANRTGLAKGTTPLQVELGLLKRVPQPYLVHAHHWLILHGRYICKAVRPACEKCVIADLCTSGDKRI